MYATALGRGDGTRMDGARGGGREERRRESGIGGFKKRERAFDQLGERERE